MTRGSDEGAARLVKRPKRSLPAGPLLPAWPSGCPRPAPIPRRPPGSPRSFPAGCGSRSSCSRPGRIAAGSRRCRNSAGRSACRWWRPATCTCTCAAGARCRTCSRPRASGPPWTARATRCSRTASGTCGPLRGSRELYPAELLAATLDVAARCRFSLDELRYEYPREIVPEGETASSWLRRLTDEGCRRRWPQGVPAAAARLIEHELALIEELRYEAYFLTVHDIVELRAVARHPLPGARLGGQFRGLLLPRHHRGGPGAHVAAVRALHLARAQRAARHRRGLRARAARGGDPVHLREVRPAPRRAHRHGDQLPAAQRAARRGKALGLDPLQVERARPLDAVVGRARIDAERVREAGLDPESPVLRARARAGARSCSASRGTCRSTSAAS